MTAISVGLLAARCSGSTTAVTAPTTLPRCGVTLEIANSTLPAGGGNGRIAVTAERECPWSATSDVPWLSFAGQPNGQGNGAVELRVAPNPDPVARRGREALNDKSADVSQSAAECTFTLRESSGNFPQAGGSGSVTMVPSSQMCSWTAAADADWTGGQTFTVTQNAGCSYQVSPLTHNVPSAGGTGMVTVASAAGCSWTATSDAAWVTITDGGNGSGSGTVRFDVAATNGPSRTATLTIAGHAFTVNQGQGCAFSLAPDTASIAAAGGPRSFEVRAANGCAWSAATSAPWISISQGASGSGNGTVSLSIAANTGPARTGTVTAGGAAFTLNQEGGCTFGITPQQQAVDAAGGAVTVTVAGPAGCSWTAASNVPWIGITSGASGNGGGAVQVTVASNTDPARTGTAVIAGQTFTVTQGSGCAYAVTPDAIAAPSTGAATTLQVATAATCTWTATSGVQWVTIGTGATGTGPGTVEVAVEPNAGSERAGSVLVAGRTIQVRQATGCIFTLEALSLTLPASGGSKSIAVTTSAGCNWTATSQAPWIAVSGTFPVSGPGVVQFTVEPNTTGAQRVGTISIAGQILTVTQTP